MKLIRFSAISILIIFLCAINAKADGQTQLTTVVPEAYYRLDIVISGKGNVITERTDFDRSSCITILKGEKPEIIISPFRGWYVEKVTLDGEIIVLDEKGGKFTLDPMRGDIVLSVKFLEQVSPSTGEDSLPGHWFRLAIFGLFAAVGTISFSLFLEKRKNKYTAEE